MGSGTLSSRTNGQTIDQTWFNQFRDAFDQDLYPRNSSGVPTDQAGSLGTSSYQFLNAYLITIYLTTLKLKNGSYYVNQVAPGGMAADYTITWPTALPGSNLPVSINASGVVTFATITSDQIADATIVGGDIAAGTITSSNITDGTIVGGDITSNVNLAGNSVASNSQLVVVSNTNAATGLSIVRGQVADNAAITTGEGFTCTAGGSGIYGIAFTTAFASAPVVVCGPLLANRTMVPSSIGGGGFNVRIKDLSGTDTNAAWSFIAIGPRS